MISSSSSSSSRSSMGASSFSYMNPPVREVIVSYEPNPRSLPAQSVEPAPATPVTLVSTDLSLRESLNLAHLSSRRAFHRVMVSSSS